MPGSVSDAYDPEFGTAANAALVAAALRAVLEKLDKLLDAERQPILDVVRGPVGTQRFCGLDERELRVLRFGLHRAMETL